MQVSRYVSVSSGVLLTVFALVVGVGSSSASAATLTVCSSGCTFTDLQAAIDAAQPGDTILLRAGETFVGHVRLPAKSNPSGAYILIRSDAPDTAMPAAGKRLVPTGYGYSGENTALSALPRLVGRGGTWRTTPVISAAPGAHHYRLQFLNIDGLAQGGFETLVEFGTHASQQSTLESVPFDIVLDRVFIHGHRTKGQKRCVSLNGRNLQVLNSYIVDCMNFAFDAQAIAGFNGPGPFKIINNYLEATGENLMFGGADPKIFGLVPADIEIRGNHFNKPLAWRNPILSPPGRPSGSVTSGGSLGAGTYYFKVVAILEAAMDIAHSLPSPEQAVSVGGSGSAVRLTWGGVGNADRYRIYVGTSPGGQNRYIETKSTDTSFTYAGGSGEVWQGPPSSATRWSVKNLLELKNAERVVIDGNVFEHLWPGTQKGYSILFTPRNEDGTAPWSVVRDVTFSNNILRHVSGGISILGEDDLMPSRRTERISIRNNLVYDMSWAWGGQPRFLIITRSPRDVKIDHNSIFHEDMVVLVDDGAVEAFRFTNNVMPHNTYGLFGSGAGMGNGAIAAYFPGGIVTRNAFGGGVASLYPADNLFLDVSTFWSQFVDPSADNFRLVSGSTLRGRGTDGKDLGVDFTELNAAVGGAVSGNTGNTGGGGDTGGGGGGGDDGGGGDPGGGSGGSTPYSSTPAPLPGTIQAEHFDNGANGVAYGDSTNGNSGGQFRNTSVDIEGTSDTGGGYNIGWTAIGEWLRYTVNVAAAGSHTIELRVAAPGTGGTVHLEVNGTDVSGPIFIPNTGGWQSWTTVSKRGVNLPAGQQVWTLVIDGAGPGGTVGNLNWIRAVAESGGGSGGSTPYGGTALALPGTLQAENFDNGSSGVAYSDGTSGNSGGQYRNTSVDIETTSDSGGGYNVGWLAPGEWLRYTVNVATGGTYSLEFRVAALSAGGTFHLEVNGSNVTGPLTIPGTGGWQSWTNVVRSGVQLPAGQQVWRFVVDSAGPQGVVGNLNYIRVAANTGGGSGGSTAFGGTPWPLPGWLQMEDFDEGGSGVAYMDDTSGNSGGQYRPTGVDIESTSGGGYNIGYLSAGEWLKYTVNVGAAGTHTLEFRVASKGTGGTFHMEVNGTNVTGPMSIPNTGAWQSWTTIRKTGVQLPAGVQVWRLVMDSEGPSGFVGNIDILRVMR